MYCRNCGAKLEEGSIYCPKCGTKQVDETPGTIYCKYCGSEIDADCVVCPKCGKQIAELKVATPNIIINNNNTNSNDSINANVNTNKNENININSLSPGVRRCNKWVAFWLCFFLGMFGAHKFYEGKRGQGVLYLLTLGLGGLGWLADMFIILFKPNPYYVILKN